MKQKQKRIILIGYKIGSRSLKNLQTQLKEDQHDRHVLRVRKNSIRYKRRPSDKIIAWGPTAPCQHTNPDQEAAKALASNKLLSFIKFRVNNVSTPEWTTDVTVAQSWNKDYLARTLLRSHSGKGIVMVPAGEVGPNAKLYVQYKKKKHEYRVHVFQSRVIDVTQKRNGSVMKTQTTKSVTTKMDGYIAARMSKNQKEFNSWLLLLVMLLAWSLVL